MSRSPKRSFKDAARQARYSIGTVIALPRAALLADQITQHADFFSFGSNDPTQTLYGLSGDDVGAIIALYQRWGLRQDPFVVRDREGGELLRLGLSAGEARDRVLKWRFAASTVGEPSSVEFCHSIGLDYVSCFPYRLPIARLAAALG